MTDIPIPKSSLPGQRAGESQGRLINAMLEINGDQAQWRPTPGSVAFADTLLTNPRGAIDKGGLLYGAALDKAFTLTANGVLTVLTNDLTGSEPVTWAKNSATPTPDLVAVSENGAFSVSASTVTAFADPDLPQPSCCVGFKNYILFGIAGGQVYATGLNAVTVDALSFDNTQGPLLRLTVSGSQVFAWGADYCSVYQDAGTSPFPLGLVTTLPFGLRGPWAVAGFGPGWDREQIFVASDSTVRAMRGLEAVPVSNKDVERAIASVSDLESLVASAYVVAGNPIWCLSSATFTWEFNLATGQWHERKSEGIERWRHRFCTLFAGQWIAGDTLSTTLNTISEAEYTENDDQVAMTIETGPVKNFPVAIKVARAFFDWTTGQGSILGTDDEVNPKVSVSWSFDGGATWSDAVTDLSLGGAGQTNRRISVGPVGITSGAGVMFKLVTSSPVYRTLRGGRVEIAGLRSA